MPHAYIIDDEPSIRQLFTIALGRAGFETHTFSTGVDFIRQHPQEPDIVIIDLVMPRLNGDEAVRICRKEWGWNRARICMVTGSLVLSRASFTGVDHVFEKPVCIDTLVKTAQRLLQAQPHPSDEAKSPPHSSTAAR